MTFQRVDKADVAHALLGAPALGSILTPTRSGVAPLWCAGRARPSPRRWRAKAFLSLHTAPWLRHMATRMSTIVPVDVATFWEREEAAGQLLMLSQVLSSLQEQKLANWEIRKLDYSLLPIRHSPS